MCDKKRDHHFDGLFIQIGNSLSRINHNEKEGYFIFFFNYLITLVETHVKISFFKGEGIIMIYLTEEKFEEIAKPILNKKNKELRQYYEGFGYDRIRMMTEYGYFSFSKLLSKVNFKEINTDEEFIKEMLDEMDFNPIYYDTNDYEDSRVLGDIVFEYPLLDFDDLQGLGEVDYEIYHEVTTGNYCTEWFYDDSQGLGTEKGYEIMTKRDYQLYDSVEEYEKERDEAIEAHLKYTRTETEEEREEFRDECLQRTYDYAIYLKSGQVAYILLDIGESIEDIN